MTLGRMIEDGKLVRNAAGYAVPPPKEEPVVIAAVEQIVVVPEPVIEEPVIIAVPLVVVVENPVVIAEPVYDDFDFDFNFEPEPPAVIIQKKPSKLGKKLKVEAASEQAIAALRRPVVSSETMEGTQTTPDADLVA